jgi:hypothetical protein
VRSSACCSHGNGSGAGAGSITAWLHCDLRSYADHRRGSPQTLPAPGQKYAAFGVVTVSSQVIPRRIRPAIDSDGEALPTPAAVESRSRRSVIRTLAVSPNRATLATFAFVGFSTLVLGDSAKRPRYATAATADSPNVQSVRRNSPLIQESHIVRLDEIFISALWRTRSVLSGSRVAEPRVRAWSDHAFQIATTFLCLFDNQRIGARSRRVKLNGIRTHRRLKRPSTTSAVKILGSESGQRAISPIPTAPQGDETGITARRLGRMPA